MVPSQTPKDGRKRILLVEDNLGHAELIARALTGNMPEIHLDQVSTLEDARNWLAMATPDLLFLDNRLPDGDGLDLLADINGAKQFPVVILSGQGNEIIAAQSIKDGAEDYVVKSAASLNAIDQVARRALAAWETRRRLIETERRLRESEARYKQTVDGVNDGVWEWDARADSYFLSSGWFRQLEYAEDELPSTREGWISVFRPEETDRIAPIWQAAIDDPGCHFRDMEYMAQTKSGARKWIYIRAQFVRDETGKVIRMSGTTTDITERKAAEAALAEAKAEAERANLAKSRFLAAASHDLRQPLHSLALFMGALQGADMSEAARAIVAKMERALQGTHELLESVLDISMLEAGVVTPDLRDCPLRELFDQIEVEFAPLAARRDLGLRVLPTSLWINSDPVLLLDLLRNLVSNAIRYTRKGRILVGARRAGAHVRIEVIDTGIGIEAAKRASIFEEFHQLGAGARNRDEGAGLGLAIVKRLCRLLDLPIAVRSVPARGSAFCVTVPRIEASRLRPAGTGVSVSGRTVSMAGSRILIIDDDPTVREATQNLLQSWGHITAAAGSLRESRRKLQNGRFTPSIIIADYHIEENVSGLDVVAGLRQNAGPDIPAILVSADNQLQSQPELEAQRIWVMQKPAKPAKLRALVDFILESSGSKLKENGRL